MGVDVDVVEPGCLRAGLEGPDALVGGVDTGRVLVGGEGEADRGLRDRGAVVGGGPWVAVGVGVVTVFQRSSSPAGESLSPWARVAPSSMCTARCGAQRRSCSTTRARTSAGWSSVKAVRNAVGPVLVPLVQRRSGQCETGAQVVEKPGRPPGSGWAPGGRRAGRSWRVPSGEEEALSPERFHIRPAPRGPTAHPGRPGRPAAHLRRYRRRSSLACTAMSGKSVTTASTPCP